MFGQKMIDDLGRHGSRLSAGTLIRFFTALSATARGNPDARARAGAEDVPRDAGGKALVIARKRVQELFGEMFERK